VFRQHAAEAELVEQSRQWLVLRLAASLLGTAMEKYREDRSHPLLERAGELFARLTDGSFARLAEDFDESDQSRLVALRASGEAVTIAGLSEGTRDQLYLALRLAYVEDYARHNEPEPFIGDDIFQTFDDARTRAGLATLAEIGGGVQAILFTHHRSVVALAKDALGPDLDLIEW
jgi:uncharacterized protein YhaN